MHLLWLSLGTDSGLTLIKLSREAQTLDHEYYRGYGGYGTALLLWQTPFLKRLEAGGWYSLPTLLCKTDRWPLSDSAVWLLNHFCLSLLDPCCCSKWALVIQKKIAVCCSSKIDEKEKKDHTSQKLRHICLGRVFFFLIEQVGGLKRKEGRREQGSERSVKGRDGENVWVQPAHIYLFNLKTDPWEASCFEMGSL